MKDRDPQRTRVQQLRRDGDYAVVSTPMRKRIEGKFPPLLDAVRENHLLSAFGEGVTTYLKAIAGPYTGEHGSHFLVIPDAYDQTNKPGVKDLSPADLSMTLQMAESTAFHTLQQVGITEVDFGWHHSRAEHSGIPKQRIATFPHNLHIHVTGYSDRDMQPISSDEVVKNPDLRGKTADAMQFIAEDILYHEVFENLLQEDPSFDALFEEIHDDRGRLRFKMRNGREGFANPELPQILQSIDSQAKASYDAVAKCFFVYDESKESFVEKDNENKRLKLLPPEERQSRVSSYIQDRPWLSRGAQSGLRFLAEQAKDEDEIIDRELTKDKGSITDLVDFRSDDVIKQAANRFWAYKDLSYTMVWSAKKGSGNSVEWIFGFDPKIFTVEGLPQSSSFTDKIILKNGEVFTPSQLDSVQKRETTIVAEVLSEHHEYQFHKSPFEV